MVRVIRVRPVIEDCIDLGIIEGIPVGATIASIIGTKTYAAFNDLLLRKIVTLTVFDSDLCLNG